MNTKNLVLMALLLGVGAALYVAIPGFNGGMKPDFMLIMMFVGILLFPDKKSVFLLAVSTGVLSGLFSTFPSGFIPNIVDKFVTAFAFYGLLLIVNNYSKKLPILTVLAGIGTFISGTVFLSVAIFIIGVELPFGFLFATVVLPTAAITMVLFVIVYPIITKIVKRSKFETALSH